MDLLDATTEAYDMDNLRPAPKSDEENAAYRDVLNQANMATFDREAKSDTGLEFVSDLTESTLAHEQRHHPRTRKRSEADQKAFVATIGAFSADLVYHSNNMEADGFMYRPSNKEDIALTLASYKAFSDIKKYWCDMGLLEMTGFIDAKDDFEGTPIRGYHRASRYKATVPLLDIAQKYQIKPDTVNEHFKRDHQANALVQLRETRGSDPSKPLSGVPIKPRANDLKPHRDRIEALNQSMQEYSFSLPEPPMVRRVFNCADRVGFNFNLGGRLYCMNDDGWMNLSKTERAEITIDNEPTCEIDVSASHLFILYALDGGTLSYSSPPYEIRGLPREIVKGLIVSAMGAGKMPTKWPRGMKDDYKSMHGSPLTNHIKLGKAVDMILNRHPALRSLEKGKLDWANLQYEEAECFLNALEECYSNWIPALSVHDSLIIKKSDERVAMDILKQQYVKRFGSAPNVTVS